MIPASGVFDQSMMTALLEHDPVVQDYRAFFALFDWALVEDWQAHQCPRGRPAHPESAYLKAFLVRIREGLPYTSQLRRFLLHHPLLVIELGFHLELAPDAPYGFDVQHTLPCEQWLRAKLRSFDQELLQQLLAATVTALKAEIPGLGETVAFDVKHIYAWVKQNNPRAYVPDRYDKSQRLAGDPDCRLGVKRSTNQEHADGTTTEKKEYLWGYGSGVAAATTADYGDVVLAEQFGYDANLRTTSASASWQSGSGNSGSAFSQSLSYDPGSLLTSLSTTQAAVPGVSASGGSETQVFCYDEQNRLTWAGNNGTPACSGNGTPSVSGNIGTYSTSYLYTHLGQLWQAPLNGGSTQQQYLYCSASQPHQLTGLYALGATCSSKTGQVYASSYDAWGNVTSRTYSGTTATLTYDLLDHLIKWYASATNQEQYVYDANGERVLRRSTNSSGTTMTVYALGLEEHQYTGSGTLLSSTYYYSLAGKLIGALDANGTTFYLTDALGSLLASFSNTVNSASLTSNQLYDPYGNARYTAGTLNTAKGFTGQYNDSLTGLDYYNARYYDPVVGVFLSADAIQGNMQGMNPYAYVGGNPETWSDPSGLAAVSSCFATCGGSGHYPTVSSPGNSLLAKAVNNWLNGGARTTVPLIGLLRTEPDHLFVWWKQPQRLHAFRVAGQDCCLRYSAHHSGRGRRLHGGGVGRRLRFFFPVCQHAVIRHGCARSGRGEHDGGRVCRSLWLSGARTGIADKSLEQEYEGVAAQELFALSAEGTPRLPRRRTVWEAPTG